MYPLFDLLGDTEYFVYSSQVIFYYSQIKKTPYTCDSNTNRTGPTSMDTKYDKGIQNLTGVTECDSPNCHILYPHTFFEGYIIRCYTGDSDWSETFLVI